MTGLAILAALSLGWHILLTLCVAMAARRALKKVPTLDQQIANLERLQALVEPLKAGLEQLDELDRQGRADVNAIKMLRNYRNN
jgi:hypothetical protein